MSGQVRLKRQLEDRTKDNRLLTRDTIVKILTSNDSLRKALVDDYKGISQGDLNRLTSTIMDFAPKTYAVLALIGESPYISHLIPLKDGRSDGKIKVLPSQASNTAGTKQPPLTDERIFRTSGAPYFLSVEKLEKIQGLGPIAKKFFAKQWIIAPILFKDHQDFPVKYFRFPFINSSNDELGHGSWGAIYETNLVEGSISFASDSNEDATFDMVRTFP